MKRLRHWLFNFAAAVSLVLCVAATFLWHRSYHANYLRIERRGVIQTSIAVYPGVLILGKVTNSVAYKKDWAPEWTSLPPLNDLGRQNMYRGRNIIRFAGFALTEGDDRRPPFVPSEPPRRFRSLIFPFWGIVLLTAVLPVASITRWSITRRRTKHGCCLVCGYDLRATPEKCPECGTIPTTSKAAMV